MMQMWLPQIYLSETYSNAGREEDLKGLMYNMAWHKYIENNQSFFGLIHMLPDKMLTTLSC